MTTQQRSKIPVGFEPAPARGPFLEMNGPIWRKPGQHGEPPIFGFVAEDRHTNCLGVLHGGMMAAFLDNAMAQSIYDRHKCRLVTLDLSVSYKHVVPKQRWLEARVSLETTDENRIEAKVEAMCRNMLCAEARGVFQLFPRH